MKFLIVKSSPLLILIPIGPNIRLKMLFSYIGKINSFTSQ